MSTELFRQERAGQIRASECCVLMGCEGYDGKIAFDLFLELKKGVGFEPVSSYDSDSDEHVEYESDDIRRGNLYEPFALRFASEDLEIGIDFAKDKDDGIRRFSRRHPKHKFMGAMPDGVFEDGWIAEAKCPRPHVLRKQLEEGPYEKFIWQMTMQLACYPEAPGARFILYDCVECRSYVYQFPREAMKIEALEKRCVDFWTRHIEGDEPFSQDDWDKPVPVPPVNPLKQADYTVVAGRAWSETVRRFVKSKNTIKAAEIDLDAAKTMIADSAQAVGLEKIKVDGHRFLVRYATRRSLDKRSVKADYPDLDFDKYMRDGKPFLEVRHYPPGRS